ncbi:MAG TPA: phosphoribosyltransferase family protein [Phycisphaerae bacterium]|nr:phosphoribosyltransferase family protein [Phycisphaerae bacterium]
MLSQTRRQALFGDIDRVVVSRRRIARRVAELGRQIARSCDGQELTIVAVLSGAMVFLSDLIRRLPLPVSIQTVFVRSYRGRSCRSGVARLHLPVNLCVRRKHVLVVDDILDSGRTLRAILAKVAAGRPASLRSCVLLRKACANAPGRPPVQFVGFDIGDEFVVGYGLDFDDRYRNLPDVCVLKPSRRDRAAGGRRRPRRAAQRVKRTRRART